MPSYEKRESGLWSVRWRELVDGIEKNKRLSGIPTKREAKEAYEEYIRTHVVVSKAQSENEGVELFGELIRLYLENQKTRLKVSTYYDTESKINNHIVPFFGTKRTKDVTPALVLQWQRTLEGYSYRYKSNLRNYLSSIFKFGERYYDVKNIMVKVEPLRNLEPKKEMLCWSDEEFRTFIKAIEDPLYNCFFRFLYVSGCRKGEAYAITFDDIDESAGTVKITKSVTRKDPSAPYAITTPKNASSNRTVFLPQGLIKDMMALKQDGDTFVFGGTRPLPDRTVTRVLDRACEKAGVKRIRLHDFRHSCASLLISKGVSIVAVSKRLGHTNIEQTLNTYSHMMPSDQDRITDIFKEF